MYNDLILAHEGPSDTRDTKIAALRLKFNAFKSLEGEKVMGTFTRQKCLLNDLENNGVTIPQAEVNVRFVNSLPRKRPSMNQTQRANNSIKNDSLATLYGKYNYEEGLIDQIYESEIQRFSIQASISKALISNTPFQDSDLDVEEDQMTCKVWAHLDEDWKKKTKFQVFDRHVIGLAESPRVPGLEEGLMPKHIAFILDGNRRWAVEKGWAPMVGHSAMRMALKPLLRKCSELKIKVVSLYAFSTENWSRPPVEVDFLMEMYEDLFRKDTEELLRLGCRVTLMGDKTKLPLSFQEISAEIEEKSRKNVGTVVIC
ncbi:retrovirus-related pol polyprotein from transposon TNT 1-94 [Tanacetum coccineum]